MFCLRRWFGRADVVCTLCVWFLLLRALGMLLTVVAYKSAVGDDLPKVAYLTSMDLFMVITYVILALTYVRACACLV